MIRPLRPFQSDLYLRILQAWQSGARDVLGVLPCGAGKSVVAAHALLHEPAASVFIAHRGELVSGESLALARNGVRHRVIGQQSLRRECSRRHLSEGLRDHIDPNARVAVASVNTLIGIDQKDPWLQSVRLVITDEAHHLLTSNSWGRALDMFPHARGLGLTATPHRADGKGLGRNADGVFDVMLEGPSGREIELMGFLCPHVIYSPKSDIDLSQVPIAASGDWSPKPLAKATHKSHIVGDTVRNYFRFTPGKLGMTFCVDVEHCIKTAAEFRAAGVSAEVITGKTPADLRNDVFRRFRSRQIEMLVSCEIAGEGFDLPDVEVIILARPSASWSFVMQQLGRVKRISLGKLCGYIIDQVGNVERHCRVKRCPQTSELYIAIGEREWSLDRRERRTRGKNDAIQLTTCPKCLRSYERVLGRVCPYCAHETLPAGRSSPEMVDGVLAELDPLTLAQMQRDILHVDGEPSIPWGAAPAVVGAVRKRHRERQEAQTALRSIMALWAGWHTGAVDVAQRQFWLSYGTDIGTAQTLGRTEADALCARIEADLRAVGVDTSPTAGVDTGVRAVV